MQIKFKLSKDEVTEIIKSRIEQNFDLTNGVVDYGWSPVHEVTVIFGKDPEGQE